MMSKILQRCKSSQGLAYVKVGEGPALVLIHGVGLRSEAWLNQLPELSKHFTLYALDMPGHGESDIFSDCSNIEDYTDVVANWVQAEVPTPVLIAGHSMGSMIALNFASRYSSLCVGAIALNSVFRRSDEAKKAVLSRADQIQESITPENVMAPVKRWFDFPLQGEDVVNAELCREWLGQGSLSGYRQAYQVFCHNDGPETDELKAFPKQALFITGSHDPNSTPAMSTAMADLCPEASVFIIENARHMAPLTHHKEINPILLKFGQECFASQEVSDYESI